MKQYRFLAVLAVAVCSVVFSAVSAVLAAVEVHDFAGLQSISKTTLREMNNDGGRYAVLAQDMLVTSDMTVFCGNNIPRKSGSIMSAGAAVYVWFNNGGGNLVDDGSYDYYTPDATTRTRTTTTTQRRTTTTMRQPTTTQTSGSTAGNFVDGDGSKSKPFSLKQLIAGAAQKKGNKTEVRNGNEVHIIPNRTGGSDFNVLLDGNYVAKVEYGYKGATKAQFIELREGQTRTIKLNGGRIEFRSADHLEAARNGLAAPTPVTPQPVVPQQSLPVQQQSQPQGGAPVVRPRRGGSGTSNGGATMQHPQPTSKNNGNVTARELLTATGMLFPEVRPAVTTVAAMDAAAQGQQTTQQRQQGTPVYDANGKLLGVTIGDKFYPAQ